MHEQNDEFMRQCDVFICEMWNVEREKKHDSILVISALFSPESTI